MGIRPESLILSFKQTALEADPEAPSASERLLQYFEAHEKTEYEFLTEYKAMVEDCPNGLVRYLLQMIISDEEKHFKIVQSMASALNSSLNWKIPPGALADLGELSTDEKEKLIRLTEDFIAEEKHGIGQYESIIKESKGYYHGLFELFIKTIIHDSKKHLMILEFLARRLKEG
jgi:rubrerythrin